MTLIDTHCHFDFNVYDEDRASLFEAAQLAGVTRIINPGTDIESSQRAVTLAREYGGIYAGVGIHPNSTATWSPELLNAVEALAASEQVVAIGEIGLDYYWNSSPKEIQWQALEEQLNLASRLELPVIIHNREASDDIMQILGAWANSLTSSLKTRPGVLHSFSASLDIAEKALDLGFYLGFTGPITFKNADDLRSIAARVPLDKILVETDGPYLTPHPYRGKRNTPAYVKFVAERLAALHQIPNEEFFDLTTANAEHLFALPT